MGTIADKLEYLNGTKAAIKTAIEGKGVTVHDGTTFRGYAALIASMPSGGIYQEKTATPTGEQFDVLPDDGYDALSKVTVAGDSALKPWNIPKGTTIYGVVGTAKLAVSTDPPADLPVTKGDADTVLTENDATADVSTFDLMVLAQDDGNITYCYLDKDTGTVSYNGVELPDIESVWTDKETYPYAILYPILPSYYLALTKFPYVWTNKWFKTSGAGFKKCLYNPNAGMTDWEVNNTDDTSLYTIANPEKVFWSNVDLIKDDVIYFAASNPVGPFNITRYDPITTEFKAKGWRRLSYHTTGELAGTWTYDDFTDTESGGWNYLKNVRSCAREKLYYNGVEVWPNYPLIWSYNGTVLPALPVWDSKTYPYAVICYESYIGSYYLYCSKYQRVWDGAEYKYIINGTLLPGAYPTHTFICKEGETVFTDQGNTNNISANLSDIFWTNTDILDAGGTVHLAASTPIPV